MILPPQLLAGNTELPLQSKASLPRDQACRKHARCEHSPSTIVYPTSLDWFPKLPPASKRNLAMNTYDFKSCIFAQPLNGALNRLIIHKISCNIAKSIIINIKHKKYQIASLHTRRRSGTVTVPEVLLPIAWDSSINKNLKLFKKTN